jgi:hypothetical protein
LRGLEDAGVNPPLGPVRFKALRLVDLLDLHGKYYDIRLHRVARAAGWRGWIAGIAGTPA